MKAFSTLLEFKAALKVGSTILIVQHEILPFIKGKVSDTSTAVSSDTLYDKGIIFGIEDDLFGVKINNTEYWFSLSAKEVPFKGSHYFFKEIQSGNYGTCYVHNNKLTIGGPKDAYTFCLISDEKSHCPICEGTGVHPVTCMTMGKPEKSITIQTCYYCNGVVVNEATGIEIKTVLSEQKKLWCSCNNDYESYYMADNKDVEVKKHHWRCCKCNKITQIG